MFDFYDVSFFVIGQLVASLLAAGATRLPVFSIGGVSLVPMLLSAGCLEAAGHLAARVKVTRAAAGEAQGRNVYRISIQFFGY